MARGGSQPGERRGGRKPGIPNKRTAEVEQRLAALRCDPIAIMASLAMDKNQDATLRGRMAAELAQYIAPKRRATEHSGEINFVEQAILNLEEIYDPQ
jgi:hypothetical protein